jgi:hypothetical protein
MAVRTALGYSGLVGTVVLYEVNGKQYMRSRPAKTLKKRTKKAIEITSVFGTVSRYGSAMIGAMRDELLFPFNNTHYNTQRGWMRNQYAAHKDDAVWEIKAKQTMTSQLNPEADLRDFMEAGIIVTDEGAGMVSMEFPSINPVHDMKAPLRTTKVNVKMMLVSSSFEKANTPLDFQMESYSFEYKNNAVPLKKFSFNTKTNKRQATGNIAIAVVALEFETRDSRAGRYDKDTNWLPAAIIAMGRTKA